MKKILIIIVLVLAGLVVMRNAVAKALLADAVRFATGVKVRINKFDLGITKAQVRAQDMRLYNPAGFPEKIMAYLPEFFVSYNLGSVLTGRPHIYTMKIYIKEFVVVKNAQGLNNVDEIKTVKQIKEDIRLGRKRKTPEFKIDVLNLKVERVVFKDYSKNPKQFEQKVYNVNIDEQYKDIDNPQKLVNLVLMRALANTAVGSLGLDLGALRQDLSGIMKQTTGAVKGFFDSIFGPK